MRLNLIILGALIALIFGLGAWVQYQTPPSIPDISDTVQALPRQSAPDIAFTDINGTAHTLAAFKNRVILVNIWASWCAPCVIEMPILMTLAKTYPNDVTIILMSVDSQKADINKFFEVHNIVPPANVIVHWDQGKKISKDVFGTIRYPETIVIDKEGFLAHKIAGVIDDNARDKIEQMVE